ncbi:MAG: glycoside hydrolase family 43 protein [Lapillicoccus sp.]
MRLLAFVAAVTMAVSAFLSGCSTAAPAGSSTPKDTARASSSFAIDQDFPDPDVLRAGGNYYAYATNSAAANVQMATSPDARAWTLSSADALPTLPAWASRGKTWAPDVSEVNPGNYVMYVVVATIDPALQCIGVAVSGSPRGPFTPVGDRPLVCPKDQGGAIDPSTFVDADGSRYLLWKNDGNCCGLDTWLQIAPLSRDGLTLTGAPAKLIKQTASWEGSLIEAPVLVKRGPTYVLLYSASNYADGSYAIGYAVSPALLGPYRKHPVPLLSTESSQGRFLGPGGQDVVTAPDGSDLLVFHSWDPALVYRGMNVLALTWRDGEPVVSP